MIIEENEKHEVRLTYISEGSLNAAAHLGFILNPKKIVLFFLKINVYLFK